MIGYILMQYIDAGTYTEIYGTVSEHEISQKKNHDFHFRITLFKISSYFHGIHRTHPLCI